MKYLLPILALFISSCSPNNNNSPQNPVINIEPAATSVSVEFGSLKLTDSQKLLSATIYNDTGATLAGPATLSSSDFAFMSGYNCSAGAKNKTSCTAIKITFNPAGKNPGEYNATLDLGTISVPIHATIESPPAPVVSVTSSLGNDINYGSFVSTTNSTVIKTISITNTGSASITGAVSLTGTAFLKNYDTCNNLTIAKGSSCQLKVSFNPYNKAAGELNETLTVNGMAISLAATVATPESIAQSGQPVVIGGVTYASDVKFYSGTSVVTEYSYPAGAVLLTTSIKNTGNLAATASSPVLSNPTNFTFAQNNCLNVALAVNQSCQLKITFSSTVVGTYTSNLTFGNKVLALSATKGCSAGFHIEGTQCVADSFTYEAVYSNYGTCSATACQGAGTQNRTITACNKLSGGVVVGTTDVVNCAAYNTVGYLQQPCSSPEGDKTISITNGTQVVHCAAGSTATQSIVSTICASGFNNQNNACVSDAISYTANYSAYGTCSAINACDGQGLKNRTIDSCQKYRNGIPEAGGQISDCAADNILANLQSSCDSPAGNKTIDISNGQQVIQCAAGSLVAQSIISTTCVSGFHNENNTCVADAITFTANYSAYGSCSTPNACDGAGLKLRTIESCQKLRNGIPEAGGQISDCSDYNIPANLQQACASPLGDIEQIIANGKSIYTCQEGSSTQVFKETICNNTFDLVNGACVAGCAVTEHRENSLCTANIRSCVVTAPATQGQETWASGSWGTCQITACSSGYGIKNGLCADNVAPVVTQTAYISPYLFGGNSLTFGGACENGLSVSISGADTSTTTCASGVWSYTTANQSTDGLKTYTITQTDSEGNIGQVQLVWNRKTTPPIGYNAVLTSAAETNNDQATIQLTCGEASSYQISASAPNPSGANWNTCSTTPITATLVNGVNTIKVWFKDSLNNLGATAITVSATLDTIPPTGYSVSRISASPTNVSPASFSLICGDAIKYNISNTQPLASAAGWTTCSPSVNASVPLTVEGTNVVKFWFKDNAGNVNSQSADASVVLDSQAPSTFTVALTTPPVTNNSTAVIALTCGDAYFYQVANTKPASDDVNWTTCTSANLNKTLVSGVNNYKFWFKDNNQNVTAISADITATLDTTAPTGVNAVLTSTTPTTDPVAVINLTCGDATKYIISATTPTVASSDWLTCTSGSINYNLNNGTNTIKFWYQDAATNISASAITVTAILSGGPANYNVVLSTSNPTNNATATFALTCGTATHYKVIQARPLGTDGGWISCVNGNINQALIEGLNNFNFWFKDVGNTVSANPISHALLLDTQPPTANSLVINNGASTNATGIVNLALASTGATQMYVTNTSGCAAGGAYENYATSKNAWVLSGFGTTTSVYAKFKDAAGNESACVSSSIYYGFDAPSIQLLSSSPTKNKAASFQIVNCNGSLEYNLSEDAMIFNNSNGWSPCVEGTVGYFLSDEDGTKTVKIWGRAGTNISTTFNSQTVILDTTPPSPPALALVSPSPYGNNYINSLSPVVGVKYCPADATGYLITESNSIPQETASGWSAACNNPQVPMTFTVNGKKRLYVWSKDLAGNVSSLPGSIELNIFGSVTELAKQSGDNQSVANGATSEAMVVKAVDENGFPVKNQSIQWSASRGVLTSTECVTNDSGTCSNTILVDNTLGSLSVTVSVGTVSNIFYINVIQPVYSSFTISASSPLDFIERGADLNLTEGTEDPINTTPLTLFTANSSLNPNDQITISLGLTPATAVNYSIVNSGLISASSINGPSFNISRGDILSSGDFKIRASSPGDATNFINSNALAVNKSRVQEFSNLGYQTTLNAGFMGVVGNNLFFVANNSLGYSKPWKYNLITKQVTQLANNMGDNASEAFYSSDTLVYNGYLYFNAYNSSGVTRIYRTDGTNVVQVTSVNPSNQSESLQDPVVYNGEIYFRLNYYSNSTTYAGDKLFKINTSNSLVQVSNTNTDATSTSMNDNIQYLTVCNGELYFVGSVYYYSSGSSYWDAKVYKTSGTLASTTKMSNINTNVTKGQSSDYPSYLTCFNNQLYFQATNGSQTELYKNTGTLASTAQLGNTNPSGSDNPYYLTVVGNKLIFVAQNASNLGKLYATDGTTVTQISDTSTGASDGINIFASNKTFNVIGNDLYFTAYVNASATKLFKTSGTLASTIQVSNTSGTNAVTDNITEVKAFNNKVYFTGNNSDGAQKLYMTTGQVAGNEIQVSNITNNPKISDSISWIFVQDNNLYIFGAAGSGNVDQHLYKLSNGNMQQMFINENIFSLVGPTSRNEQSIKYSFMMYNGGMVIKANTDRKLIDYSIADNTSSPIYEFKSLLSSDSPSSFVTYNGELYFVATNSGAATKLYKTNGNSIEQVSNTRQSFAIADSINTQRTPPKVCNNQLFFVATSKTGLQKIFKTSGNLSSTVQVSNTNPAGNDINTNLNWTCWNDELYYIGYNANSKFKLMKTDGVSVTQLSNLQGDSNNDISNFTLGIGSNFITENLVSTNNGVYFFAYQTLGNLKLYKYNGTLTAVSNTASGSTDLVAQNSSLSTAQQISPTMVTDGGNNVYFFARTSGAAFCSTSTCTSVLKLFKNDGTTTVQVSNVNGPTVSDILYQNFTSNPVFPVPFMKFYNGKLYYVGQNSTKFAKLYASSGTTSALVANINSASTNDFQPTGAVSFPVIFNNEMYITALQGSFTKLYKINSSNSLSQAININPGANDSPFILGEYGGELYFSAALSNVAKLYKLNPTSGLSRVSSFTGSEAQADMTSNYLNYKNNAVFNNELYFSGQIITIPSTSSKMFRLCNLSQNCSP